MAENISYLKNEETERRGDANALPFRAAPQNVEAEQALIGAILINNDAYYRVSDFLKTEHFQEPIHRQIFKCASDMIRVGKKADPRTIKTFLREDDKIGDMTVAQYLARLAAEATTIINAADYGRLIHDLAVRRSLITIGEDMVNIAYDAPVDVPPSGQIEDAERRLFELAETGSYGGGFQEFSDAIQKAIELAGAAYERDGGLSGISTGIHNLDQRMGGLQKSDLIIVAGRPGMGKTSLATNIAFNIAHGYEADINPDGSHKALNGGVVGFFSLEMSADQLATRIISEQAEVSSSKIRRGEITEAEFVKLSHCSSEMQRIPLYIDETGGISIAQLAARARRLKRQRGLDVMVVDYIQLMQGSKRSGENRVQEVTEITTGLKALAKELDIPIIALSQLSRQVESRDDKRPQLSDLRESGSIEQDADVVLFVFREEYYMLNSEPRLPADASSALKFGRSIYLYGVPDDEQDNEKIRNAKNAFDDFRLQNSEYEAWAKKFDDVRGRADVIIAKQRHGPTGTANLGFQAQFTRFSDLAEDSEIAEYHG